MMFMDTGLDYLCLFVFKSRDSSVGIALGYGMDDPAGAGNCSEIF